MKRRKPQKLKRQKPIRSAPVKDSSVLASFLPGGVQSSYVADWKPRDRSKVKVVKKARRIAKKERGEHK